jgi:Tfp pilus assembly protein PilZ
MMKKEAEQTVENSENRDTARMDHVSSLQVQDLASGKIYKARMFNFSKEGVYFESDSVLTPGTQIYIGIQNSPYASLPDVLEYHQAQIMWRKKLKRSYFRFGYGIKLASLANKQDLKPANKPDLKSNDSKQTKESRKHPRRPYDQFTLFTTQNGIFEGSINNISSSGVFLKSKNTFEVGQILSLVLPFKNGKDVKVKGQIVWTNDEGFGIKFLSIDKKSSPPKK